MVVVGGAGGGSLCGPVIELCRAPQKTQDVQGFNECFMSNIHTVLPSAGPRARSSAFHYFKNISQRGAHFQQ